MHCETSMLVFSEGQEDGQDYQEHRVDDRAHGGSMVEDSRYISQYIAIYRTDSFVYPSSASEEESNLLEP